MINKIIKKYLGRHELSILKLLGVHQYIKFLIYKIVRKRYSLKYNKKRIYLRPWIKSDISGVLSIFKQRENNYINEINNKLKRKKQKIQLFFSI